ncbi:serine carboxypeptidase S28-domain-containing protein [Pavlovales sp. CCMP2436]|nr:serine carboxypeptidase S28-domain-containing protein [Pavlovales sp. CCMP2436]
MKELQRFILRTATLALYRHALRSARSLAPAHAAPHLRAEIRARFSERAREVVRGSPSGTALSEASHGHAGSVAALTACTIRPSHASIGAHSNVTLTLGVRMSLLHNSSSAHASAAATGALHAAQYRAAHGEASGEGKCAAVYEAGVQPLPRTGRQDLQARLILAVLSAIFILIPFCYVPAAFATQVLLSGSRVTLYWLSTYLADLLAYVVLAALVMCVLLAYGEPSLVGDAQTAGALFGHILLYGAAVFPHTYAVSLAFFTTPHRVEPATAPRTYILSTSTMAVIPKWLLALAALPASALPPRFPRLTRVVVVPGEDHPAQPSVRDCEERWFEQHVDHFDARQIGGTWMQRYFVCRGDLLARADSPILFYCGNEANVELYVNATGLMWEHADALGAGLVFSEHRFFGKSMPAPPEQLDASMGLLSSEQALADYATLLEHIRSSGGRRRPAVAFGGSYGGMLAAWLRMKYPGAVDGAVSASAPILSFLGLDPSYDAGSFGKGVTYDASAKGGGSHTCVQRVSSAWKALFELGKSAAGRRQLDSIFQLCPSSRLGAEEDVLSLAGWLQSAMDFMAMGSYPYSSSYMLNGGGVLPPYPLREMCRLLGAADEAPPRAPDVPSLLASLREGVGIFYNYTGSPASARGCFELAETGNNETTRDGQLWDYLYCSDMLQPAARDGVSDMFYPQPFILADVVSGCRGRWQVEPRPDWPTINYGGWKALEAASNLVFTNGELDPWKGGGVLQNVSSSVQSFVIPEMGHHVDLFFSQPGDTAPLRAVRAAEMDAVRGWIRDSAEAEAARHTSEAVPQSATE